VELLLDAVPNVRRIGFLADPNTLSHGRVTDAVRRALAQHSVQGRFAEAGSTDAIEPAMSRLAKDGGQALVVMGGSRFVTERQRIVKRALSTVGSRTGAVLRRLPLAVSAVSSFVPV
jgi:hypothetical protein